jgi:hypothetical protein
MLSIMFYDLKFVSVISFSVKSMAIVNRTMLNNKFIFAITLILFDVSPPTYSIHRFMLVEVVKWVYNCNNKRQSYYFYNYVVKSAILHH